MYNFYKVISLLNVDQQQDCCMNSVDLFFFFHLMGVTNNQLEVDINIPTNCNQINNKR
jgi:hypothetical protein